MLPYIYIIVPFYGIFVALGFMAALLVFKKRSRMASLDIFKSMQATACVAIGMLMGSRAVFVMTMLPAIIEDFSFGQLIKVIFGGGFVFYGGLLGAIVGLYCYGKLRKIDLDSIFQAAIPCFPLFHAFGRIGCFMTGCCYGLPCSFGFAMVTDPEVIRFPVQLVESLFCFVIFVMLIIIEKKSPSTKLLSVYLISYAVVRFGLEFFRGDAVRGRFMFLSTSQWISLSILSYFIIKIIMYRSTNNSLKKIVGRLEE